MKIYAMPEMEILGIINFEDNKTRSEDTQNSYSPKKRDDNLMFDATSDGIDQIKNEIQNFFTPKGYILRGRTDGKKFIFETTLGADKVKEGLDVDIYTIKIDKNPITNKIEKIESQIAKGKVSEKIDSNRSWIIVKQYGENIRVGDYIKVKFHKSILNQFKGMGSAFNKITQ